MASPTLLPRFEGQSYRKLVTAYPSYRLRGPINETRNQLPALLTMYLSSGFRADQ